MGFFILNLKLKKWKNINLMFSYLRTIYLNETDATGVLFFSHQFTIAIEALENFFLLQGFSLKIMIEEKSFFLPIVHAEANFLQPVYVGDQMEIRLELEKIGESSFVISSCFHHFLKGEVGNTKIIQVSISKETKKSIPIPQEISQLLQKLSFFQESGIKSESCGNFEGKQ